MADETTNALAIAPEKVPTFKGKDFEYKQIAFNDNLTMGIHLSILSSPMAPVCGILTRFVVIGPEPYLEKALFVNLKSRGMSQYTTENGNSVSGLKLSQIPFPVFENVCPHTFRQVADNAAIWTPIADWIAARVTDEHYVLSVFDLPGICQSFFDLPEQNAKLILTFPDLNKVTDEAVN